MTGCVTGVFAFVQKGHPAVFLARCVCHLIHIAAEKDKSLVGQVTNKVVEPSVIELPQGFVFVCVSAHAEEKGGMPARMSELFIHSGVHSLQSEPASKSVNLAVPILSAVAIFILAVVIITGGRFCYRRYKRSQRYLGKPTSLVLQEMRNQSSTPLRTIPVLPLRNNADHCPVQTNRNTGPCRLVNSHVDPSNSINQHGTGTPAISYSDKNRGKPTAGNPGDTSVIVSCNPDLAVTSLALQTAVSQEPVLLTISDDSGKAPSDSSDSSGKIFSTVNGYVQMADIDDTGGTTHAKAATIFYSRPNSESILENVAKSKLCATGMTNRSSKLEPVTDTSTKDLTKPRLRVADLTAMSNTSDLMIDSPVVKMVRSMSRVGRAGVDVSEENTRNNSLATPETSGSNINTSKRLSSKMDGSSGYQDLRSWGINDSGELHSSSSDDDMIDDGDDEETGYCKHSMIDDTSRDFRNERRRALKTELALALPNKVLGDCKLEATFPAIGKEDVPLLANH